MISKSHRRVILPLLVLCAVAARAQQAAVTLPSSTPAKQAKAASDAYLEGARFLDHNDAAAAEKAFARAATLDPNNRDYALSVALAHQRRITELIHQAADARLHGHPAEAETLLAQARLLDPQNSLVAQHPAPTAPISHPPALAFEEDRPTLPGTPGPAFEDAIAFAPATGKNTFHIHASQRDAITQAEAAYGLKVVFDDSVSTQPLRFDLEDVTYAQAIPVLLSMAHVFAVPLDSKTAYIAKDTLDNHNRLDRQVQETIYIPGQTITQLQDIANIIRNLFEVKTVTIQQTQSSLILRSTPDSVRAVNLTLADLLDGGAEVVLEMKIYSVDITHGRDIGFQPPQFGAYNVTAAAQALVSANQSLVNQAISEGLISSTDSVVAIAFKLIASGLVSSSLLTNTIAIFGGSINPTTGAVSNEFTTTGITTSSNFTFNLNLTASDTRALEDVQTRIADRETAVFRSGSRYPITTSTYATPSSSALAGVTVNGVSASSLLSQYLGTTSTTTIPQISYEDLGLTLKATPAVQKSGRIFMHLDLKLEALSGGTENAIPILNSRQLTSDVTVAEGESALLVSTLSKSETAAVTGLPGLTELPGFQVPTEKNTSTDSSEMVILITPRVIRHRATNLAGPRIAFYLPPSQRPD